MAVVAELDPEKDSLLLASMGVSIIGLVANGTYIWRKRNDGSLACCCCPGAAKSSGSADLNTTPVIEMVSNPIATRNASQKHAEYVA